MKRIESFSFFTPTRIEYGAGKASQLADEVKGLNGKRLLVVTDKGIVRAGVLKRIEEQLIESKLEGKLAGAFGSYTHSGDASAIIFDTMQYVYKMVPFELGSFNLKEAIVETSEDMHSCQDYGRVFGEKLGS